MNLQDFYSKEINPKCEGCGILSKNLLCHCVNDIDSLSDKKIMFLSDFPKVQLGDFDAFRANEYTIIKRELDKRDVDISDVCFTYAVKCPLDNAKQISAKDRKICREHLKDTLLKVRPELIFVCGKLASTMIFGRDVAESKIRGKIIDYDVDGVFRTKICQIFHPWQAVIEPKNRYLFNLDIKQAIRYHIDGKETKSDFCFSIADKGEDLDRHRELFIDKNLPISVDIETTGLNFLTDRIHTIAFTTKDEFEVLHSIAIPWDHAEDTAIEELKKKRLNFIKEVIENPNRIIILQNCKFDMKFLIREGIEKFHEVWDCKLMQHLYREDVPKSLMDLAKYYYPDELQCLL